MTPTEIFVAYATEFEKTYEDDDWARLERFFAPQATYEVRGAVPFACRLEGREAILRGIRKSVDGFDRRFDSREVEIVEPPREEGDTVTVGWKGTYRKQGLAPLVLRGRSRARCQGDRIVELSDSYDDDVAAAAAEWSKRYPGFDPSYV
ncbi:MAG: nuclear transport factor 2 family protein [Candidatus Binatia bacterium]